MSLPNKGVVIPVVEQRAASLADGYTPGPLAGLAGPLAGLGAIVHSKSLSVRGVGNSAAVDMEARAYDPQV